MRRVIDSDVSGGVRLESLTYECYQTIAERQATNASSSGLSLGRMAKAGKRRQFKLRYPVSLATQKAMSSKWIAACEWGTDRFLADNCG